MKIKKLVSIASALVTAASCLVSCSNSSKNKKTPEEETSLSSENTTEEFVFDGDYPSFPVSYPEIELSEFSKLYEAEEAEFNGKLKVKAPKDGGVYGLPTTTAPAEKTSSGSSENYENYENYDTAQETTTAQSDADNGKMGYSGKGYVTEFKKNGNTSVIFNADIPSNQHYDISFSIACDRAVNCTAKLNGKEIGTFKTRKNGKFTLITLSGIYIDKGKAQIELNPTDGDIKLDYMRIKNNSTLRKLSYKADGSPVNKNSSDEVKALMTFFTQNYGEYLISGQYASDSSNKELNLTYSVTGKYPVIRFAALSNKDGSFESCLTDAEACAEWHRNGGIAGLSWFWEAPGKERSAYASETDFRLSEAVTDIDIAPMTQEEIRGLYGEGRISEKCYGLILDLDSMAEVLLSLKNKDIPVLWRPLHEASGDWFWWGADGVEAYAWLWELMYDRYTKLFNLDNLIWVWSGQGADTLVAKNTFDIAAADIYLGSDADFGSRYEQFVALQKVVGPDKLIGMSENSRVPDINEAFRDNTVWLFDGLWYGSYIMDENGNYSDKYCSKEDFAKFYNSQGVLTLDEYQKLLNGEPLEDEPETTAVSTTKKAETTTKTATATGTQTSVSSETTTKAE